MVYDPNTPGARVEGSKRMKRSDRWRPAILLLAFGLAWSARTGAETLDYRATYQGVFSAFQEVPVGDVRLVVDRTDATYEGQAVYRARLTASSEAYPVVERFYPFRYDFTSYHQRGDVRSLAYERRKQTTRTRHDLILLDRDRRRVSRYEIAEARRGAPPDDLPPLMTVLRAAGLPDHAPHLAPQPWTLDAPPGSTLDRLALLQQLRELPLRAGVSRELVATDGKEYMPYLAIVVGREAIETGQGTRQAWKIRIEGFEADGGREVSVEEAGSELPAPSTADDEAWRHPPVYVWIDAGPRRLPLRFVSRHAIGEFIVELDSASAVQSASLDPGAEANSTF